MGRHSGDSSGVLNCLDINMGIDEKIVFMV